MRTLVLSAGSNRGAGGDVPLRYAENDAGRIVSLFEDLGFDGTEIVPVIGGNADDLQKKFRDIEGRVRKWKMDGHRVTFLVYFSGHGDRDFLRMDMTRLTWSKFRDLVQQVQADVTVAIVDTCQSGSAITAKASRGPPFPVIWRREPVAEGVVWVSSSREAEASFESDELTSSFFSHYLISGLRGAADTDENGIVSLGELYHYTYQHTVARTSMQLNQVQHPTYDFDLRGEGEVALTRVPSSGTNVVLPRELQGVYFIARRFGTLPNVVEVAKEAGRLSRIGVKPGSYLVFRRDEDRLWLTTARVSSGEEWVLEEAALKPVRYRDVVSKGGQISLSTPSVMLSGMAAGPVLADTAPGFGGSLGLGWRWLRAGLLGESSFLTYGFDSVDARVDNWQWELSFSGELFWTWSTLTLMLRAGAGGMYLRQQVQQGPVFDSYLVGLLAAAGVELEVWDPFFLRAELSCDLWFVERPSSLAARLRPTGRIGLGYRFY